MPLICRLSQIPMLAAIACAAFGCGGCWKSGYNTEKPRRPAAIDPFAEDGTLVREEWFVHRVKGSKIGHRHTQVYRLEDQESHLQKTVATDSLEFRRFGGQASQVLTQISVENNDASVRAFGYGLQSDDSATRYAGQVSGNSLLLKKTTGPDRQQKITFPSAIPGVFSVEQSLVKKPMVRGESRTVRVFRPQANQIATVQLQAEGVEEVEVLATPMRLLRIGQQDLGGDEWANQVTHWADEEGVIWKSAYPFLNREICRCGPETAQARNDLIRFDMGLDAGVTLDTDFPDPANSKRAVYEVRLETLRPDQVFAKGPGQEISILSDRTALVTVTRVSPDGPSAAGANEEPPTNADLDANEIIDCDHPSVAAAANALGSSDQPWELAKTIKGRLYRTISKSEFSQVFDRASAVAEKKSGDCSEHAVLLAAICRAKQIPARVAVGLAYDQQETRFLFHMWNEVWVSGRWIPIDATIPGAVAADHIKFKHSSLSGQTPLDILSPVMAVVGQLEIKLRASE